MPAGLRRLGAREQLVPAGKARLAAVDPERKRGGADGFERPVVQHAHRTREPLVQQDGDPFGGWRFGLRRVRRAQPLQRVVNRHCALRRRGARPRQRLAQQVLALLQFQAHVQAGPMLQFEVVPERLPRVQPRADDEFVGADAARPEGGFPAIVLAAHERRNVPAHFVGRAPTQFGRQLFMAVRVDVGADQHTFMRDALDRESAAVHGGADLLDRDARVRVSVRAGPMAPGRFTHRLRGFQQEQGAIGWRQDIARRRGARRRGERDDVGGRQHRGQRVPIQLCVRVGGGIDGQGRGGAFGGAAQQDGAAAVPSAGHAQRPLRARVGEPAVGGLDIGQHALVLVFQHEAVGAYRSGPDGALAQFGGAGGAGSRRSRNDGRHSP
ncbi:hypothetical protein D9M68_640280 [compost metagenome]